MPAYGLQYGFRKSRGTSDAVFIGRRIIETTCAQRSGRLSLVALDWAKAFDSVNVDSLLDALRRFGIPHSFIDVVAALLRNRKFYVEDWVPAPVSRPNAQVSRKDVL